ncbi:hypothetical protein KR074_006483 [Drosophila pseudoananassae]|nr:hypothetical protein KR074_006483 [Drosophila pseudoananassae]
MHHLKNIRNSTKQYDDSYLTGSRFTGQCNDLGMQDFGTYVYPDGTRYSGYFLNNRFHGKGTIQMPDPAGITFAVVHNNGRLEKIEKMNFNDCLPVEFDVRGSNISFKRWNYCSSKDRRFHKETLTPMEAVGPNKFQTANGPEAPNLPRNVFDLGFGLLTQHGFVLDNKDFGHHVLYGGSSSNDKSFYLGCREARRWIRENCAHGQLWNRHIKQKIISYFTRNIIQNNIENSGCSKLNDIPKGKMCRRSNSADSLVSENAKMARLHVATDSISCSSEVHAMKETRYDCGCSKKPDVLPWRRSLSESNVCRIN